MGRWIRAIFALLCALLASACDQQGRFSEQAGLDRLAKGTSSESEVVQAMGRPDTVWEEEDGSRTLEYPTGPAGHRTWMVEIDRYGKLKDYRQVLSEETFARIGPGMSKDAVRRLLGRPRSVVQFKLKNEEVWDWRYLQSNVTSRLFNVHFDIASGRVTRTSAIDDQASGY